MNDQELREIPFSSETIYDGAILRVEKWQVTCPNGHAAPREIVVHKGAAAVIPVYEDGTTLLVRQHRVSVDRVTLEIPAGKLDSWGEDPYDCAVRELKEETGLTVENPKLCGVKQFPIDGGRYLVFFFKTDRFMGDLCSSKEGKMEWISREALPYLNTVSDFMDMLKVFDRDDLTEFQYVVDGDNWNVILK